MSIDTLERMIGGPDVGRGSQPLPTSGMVTPVLTLLALAHLFSPRQSMRQLLKQWKIRESRRTISGPT